MTTQETHKIQSILNKVNSEELKQFPATRNRLMVIVNKIKQQIILSENDYATLQLNNLNITTP